MGGWVGPRAVLDVVVKRKIPSPSHELNPRTPIVQHIAQCYTDSTSLNMHHIGKCFIKKVTGLTETYI
jgi:hypothetical protein